MVVRYKGKLSGTKHLPQGALLVKRENKRIWAIRRLMKMGASSHDLVDMYIKQIRSILEFAVPAWQGALTPEDKIDLERIQNSVAHIILELNLF